MRHSSFVIPADEGAQHAEHTRGMTGSVSQGLTLLEKAVNNAESQPRLSQYSQQLNWLSEAYLIAGRTDDAIVHAKSALKLARHNGERSAR